MTDPAPEEPTIDAVGADEVETVPATQPLFPTVADLLPAKVRVYVYALLPVLLICLAIFDFPNWADKVTLILSALGFGVAASNVPVVKKA